MLYRDFGQTGEKISALGFGTMRLPMEGDGEEARVKEEEAIGMMHRAFELGVNYIDTAYGYCNGQSEVVVGKALEGRRNKVLLSTKIPTWRVKKTEDYRLLLEEQLGKLGTYIDFYHFHGLSAKRYEEVVLGRGLIAEAVKAKEEGLIRHISFSFHDKPEVLMKIVDSGVFETILCQYNLLDRSNEESITYARQRGLGTVAMGPVGGGRLGVPSAAIQSLVPGGLKTTAEMALRFVFANSSIDCALSGMNTTAMVEENAGVASRGAGLSEEETVRIKEALEESRKLADLYCTGCDYCLPCQNGVKISENFLLMNYHRIYNLSDYARQQYRNMSFEARAENCRKCGECEERCPQDLEIRRQLEETARVLG
jgi:predicted aldo/keto reductase-like oxidoreductase